MKSFLAGLAVLAGLCQSSLADPDSLRKAEQALRQADANDRGPSFSEFVTLLNREDIHLDRIEFFKLRSLLETLQKPEITCDDLAKRISAKQKKITSYVAYLGEREMGTNDPKVGVLYRRYELTSKGEKALGKRWDIDAGGQTTAYRVSAFDGEIVRRFNSQSHQGAMGLLQPEYRYDLIEAQVNPIGSSMLLNSKALLEQEIFDVDLAAMLKSDITILYGDRQEVDGRSCLIASALSTVVYLDPELDFRVVRRENWTHHPEADDQLQRSEWVTTYSDFREFDCGLFFARKATFENTATGRRNVVSVDSLVINGNVEDSVFRKGVIPKGTESFDERTNEAFVSDGNER